MRRLTIEVGGLAIAFESDDPRWEQILEPRYGAFRTGREPGIVVTVTTSGEPRGIEAVDRLRSEAARIDRDGTTVRLLTPSLEASVEPGRGIARLTAPLDRHGIDLLLPLLLALHVDDALLLHATLAIDGERAFVCAGPSGAGKSTLARLLGERAYCDELVLLRRRAEGWRAHALPYWHGRPGSATLAGLRLLRHGDRHELLPVPAERLLRAVARELIWPTYSEEACARSLELVARLVAEVPAAELAFRPSPGVWPVLAGERAA